MNTHLTDVKQNVDLIFQNFTKINLQDEQKKKKQTQYLQVKIEFLEKMFSVPMLED